MPHGSSKNLDPIRKSFIIAVLIALIVGLHRFGNPHTSFDPAPMIALGFVILAAYTVGQLAELIRLPHITGYLIAGTLLGEAVADRLPAALRAIPPFGHGVIDHNVYQQLSLLNVLAYGLIALTAGGELKLDTLKRGWRAILGLLGAQTISVLLGSVGFFLLISQETSFGLVPLQGLSTLGVVAVGAVVGSISLATSPAATVAIINETKAEGPYSRLILSSVVLKDVLVVVLFSVTALFASVTLQLDGANESLIRFFLVHILGSLAVGGLLSGLLVAYIRYVGSETLLFLVGLIYAASFFGERLELDPVLMFISAGFITSNFSTQGVSLIETIERLSLPVYVVFFTLAGAHLDLNALFPPADSSGPQMLPFVLGLVGVRLFSLWVGVSLGAKLSKTPSSVRRYGWMGFASQAGVALLLGGRLGGLFPQPLGGALETIIIAGVAINELIGPIFLKIALGLAQELPGEDHSALVDELSGHFEAIDLDGFTEWSPRPDLKNPWSPPLQSQSSRLNRISWDMEGELRGIAREFKDGPLVEFQSESERFLRDIRRAFLRHHHRITKQSTGVAPDRVADLFRAELGELSRRWREIVLLRAARTLRPSWQPTLIVDAIDQLIATLPETVDAPWEPLSFEEQLDEAPLLVLRRRWLRLRSRWYKLTSSKLPHREVEVQTLARYHFSGRLPQKLEGVAALLTNGEAHIAGRSRSVFDAIAHGYETVAAQLSEEGGDLNAMLLALRKDIEEEFRIAEGEIHSIGSSAAYRLNTILAIILDDFKADLPVFNTLDLASHRRRFSLIFRERTRGIETLSHGYRDARAMVATRYEMLALELELIGLEGRIRSSVEEHGDQLARLLRGRGPHQLQRVNLQLEKSIDQLQALFKTQASGDTFAAQIRTLTAPLAKVVGEAGREVERLRADLTHERSVGPLIDSLLSASQSLTERYTVPTHSVHFGEWTLPEHCKTIEVNFRDVVLSYIESSVTRKLNDLTHFLDDEVKSLAKIFDELDRIVAFNVELAEAELEVLGEETVPEAVSDLVHDMVLGALSRSRNRVLNHAEHIQALPENAKDQMSNAVFHDLERIRSQVIQGQVGALRQRIRVDALSKSKLSEDADRVRRVIQQNSARAAQIFRRMMGEDRIALVRQWLGIQQPTLRRATPGQFAKAQANQQLPNVYRRLFSDKAMEAGDLLTGRQEEIAFAQQVLSGELGGTYRSTAIIGMEGIGKGAVINALCRGIPDGKVVLLTLEAPATVEQIAAWFNHHDEGKTYVIKGFSWLFRMDPGGFGPLRRLSRGIIEDAGRNAWLLSAPLTVWDYALRFAPLEDAFPHVIRLAPLSPSHLATAILARHAMSGYDLRFEAQDDLGWQLQHLISRRGTRFERQREAWFRTLHAASNGVVNDALSLWMASIRKIDDVNGVVRVGPVPRPPVAALNELPEATLLTLKQVLRQGWIDSRLHSSLFHVDHAVAQAHLAHLSHLGLFEQTAGVCRIPTHLKASILQILDQRRWME